MIRDFLSLYTLYTYGKFYKYYYQSIMSGRGKEAKTKSKPKSRSSRAGLQFGRIHHRNKLYKPNSSTF